MGQGKDGVTRQVRVDGSSDPGISPRENSRQLEGEIAVLRDELAVLVAELDRRRHELTDFKLQARRHAVGGGPDRRGSAHECGRLRLAEHLARLGGGARRPLAWTASGKRSRAW